MALKYPTLPGDINHLIADDHAVVDRQFEHLEAGRGNRRIHGGGWVLFDIDTYDASCRGLVNKAGCIVVSPEYRRAPEHVFPASHDDVLVAYQWTRENAAQLGGDPTRMAIGGESVGGTMATATCLQLKEAGKALPVFQVMVYPLTTGEQ